MSDHYNNNYKEKLMHDYEPDVWATMIEKVINKHGKYLADLNFWVETRELTDRHGNTINQDYPRLAINFK